MSHNFRVKCIQNIEGRSGALILLGTFPSLANGGGLMDETCVSCLFKGSGGVYLIENDNVEFIYFQILKI